MRSDVTGLPPAKFTVVSRLIHWSMAVMVIGQFFLGLTLVVALAYYPLLLAIHRFVGILILAFAVVRVVNRFRHRPPPLPESFNPIERVVSTWSERLMYLLLIAQPLTGWALLSAADSPVVLVGSIHLPDIAPHSIAVYSLLRLAHTVLAYLLFATFTAHVCAVTFHSIGLRDGLFSRMSFSLRRKVGMGRREAPARASLD